MARVTLLLLPLLGVGLGACAGDDDDGAPAATATEVVSTPATTAAPAPVTTTAAGSSTPGTTVVVGDPALRDELLAMLIEDQAVRTGVAPPGDDRTPDELFGAMDEVDAANTARILEVFDEHGWPGWALVGRDGSTAAWAIVQHADLQPAVQQRGLELLRVAVDAGDASPGDLAYLEDRVRVAAGEPQAYGTQWETDATGSLVPRTPIEDPATVDDRRVAAGLGTIEEYLEELAIAFAEPVPTTPIPSGAG